VNVLQESLKAVFLSPVQSIFMKYKRLTTDELNALEKEFINFLSSAQITANDWEKMKKSEQHKAQELIDIFSDVVYDKVLRKIKYAEYRDEKTLNLYFFGDEKIELVGIRVSANSHFNLNTDDLLSQWNVNKDAGINIFKSEKIYNKVREEEVFELLQNGCNVTDEKYFKLLSGLVIK
jgi:NAD-specific glutamate dehydrogenase